ncbi:NAD(P)/FAD-dependent oxidoreductase [Achromobacter seleniivolatilans]|uniref:Pyridine nucleotide-disulfide oxidoreductase domain-containing protein 2 n=1 Tax=Achromobacter seleniivolatilans TaxID=3047478 RepID=A0ABY9M740_9BURK|nr:NAD(P)/FAD-dependent oxidoreductase [Achromobacter sp. R39]WMD22823.1 NAD(P)/FAD-dependent oxidoreductase [Achromobacter sp. R39]
MAKPSDAQVIIVGSGMNSLVCAALLAQRGKSVLVLERNDRLGGCIRTEELFPGYRHDVLSCWYPLFVGSPAYAALKPALAEAGLEFMQCGYTTGLVLPDGSGLALTQDLQDTASRLDAWAPGDGAAFAAMAQRLFGNDAALTFGLLGQNPYGAGMFKLLFKEWRKRGMDGLAAFAAASMEPFRRWAERELQSDAARAMIAPWVLHTGLGPDDACSALIGKLTFAAVVAGGMPVVKGGGSGIVAALAKVIERHGGRLLTSTPVERILTQGEGRRRRAVGVVAAGREYHAADAVVCNVTPGQLYGHLLPDAPAPVRQRAAAYRYGRGGMQIHFALNAPPDWLTPELRHVPLVHLTESMEQVCASVTEANNGLLPARPTLAIGQPVAVDTSRAPAGGWILWVQMQELPVRVKGDAAGQISVPEDGRWNAALREAVADRVQARLESVMPGLAQRIVGRRSYSPADLEGMNCNLVGGDPYSGVCSPDQFFWLRPFAGSQGARGHRTPLRNLFHIGASTHPGPGLGGGSGYLVAQHLAPQRGRSGT